MTVTLMPDVEYILWDFLSQDADVSALVSSRIYKAALPKDPVGPLIRLTRVTGSPVISFPLVMDESRVQFDCYGGSQRDANRLAETVRAVLAFNFNNYVHADGTIVSVHAEPPFYDPDPNWNTDRGGSKPRYIFDTILTSRPPIPA